LFNVSYATLVQSNTTLAEFNTMAAQSFAQITGKVTHRN
jgi:hypothetical protein